MWRLLRSQNLINILLNIDSLAHEIRFEPKSDIVVHCWNRFEILKRTVCKTNCCQRIIRIIFRKIRSISLSGKICGSNLISGPQMCQVKFQAKNFFQSFPTYLVSWRQFSHDFHWKSTIIHKSQQTCRNMLGWKLE